MKTKKNRFLMLIIIILIVVGVFMKVEEILACGCNTIGGTCIFVPVSTCSETGHGCLGRTSFLNKSICTINGPNIYDPGALCTSVSSWEYCSEDLCNTYVSGALVNDSATNGRRCRVTTDGMDTCSHYVEGKWDNSDKKCVVCDGSSKEIKVAGDTAANYVVGPSPYSINATGISRADGDFESACGADTACDEKKVGDNCGGGKVCDAIGACVAVVVCNNNNVCEPGLGETTANCPNDCCVNKTCADPAVCSDAVNCLNIEPACVGFCMPALTACDPDCSAWQCTSSGDEAILECPAGPGSGKCFGAGGLDGSPCPGGTWSCDGCKPQCDTDFARGCGIQTCTSDIEACDCDCLPVAAVCNFNGIRDNGETGVDCGGGGCPACPACIPIGPENCNNTTGDEDCNGLFNCADPACPDGTNCGGINFCNIGVCVECLVNTDCEEGEVCNSGICTPCVEEGFEAANVSLCCVGLSLLNIDDDLALECTSRCDPSAWFFCNPLRGTVETIVQAGEQLLGYILGLIGSIALLFIIIAGIMYMTSAGNEERIASSKRILTGAVIGLTIALLAYGLLHVIMTVLGI